MCRVGGILKVYRYDYPHVDNLLCSSLIWKLRMMFSYLLSKAHKHLKACTVFRPVLATSVLTDEMYFLLDHQFQGLLFMQWTADEIHCLKDRKSLTSLFDQEKGLTITIISRTLDISVTESKLNRHLVWSWKKGVIKDLHLTEVFCSYSLSRLTVVQKLALHLQSNNGTFPACNPTAM